MAKVTGPLHSLRASGTIGQTLTLLDHPAHAIAKKNSRPGGPPSAAQLARRALYSARAAAWNALTTEQKAEWNSAANARQITPFNAFMSAGLGSIGVQWDGGAAQWDGGAAVWS